VLGIAIEEWGGALLRCGTPEPPPFVVWSSFQADTDYIKPSSREFMLVRLAARSGRHEDRAVAAEESGRVTTNRYTNEK
jgi:hypothetical protein